MSTKHVVTVLWMILVIFLAATNLAGSQNPKDLQANCLHKPKVTVPVSITWLGHSCFRLESADKIVFIDPFISYNPACPIKLDDITRADIILITHDHGDHVGDAIDLAKKTGAMVVTLYETAAKLISLGLPEENVFYGGINIGGEVNLMGISIVMTPAMHSSESGSPAGYIIRFPGKGTIYHAGDTGIFGEMSIYGALYPIHVALLPIGNVYTMESKAAALSLQYINPCVAIPMHYATFPILEPTAEKFICWARKLAPCVDIKALTPGETFILGQD